MVFIRIKKIKSKNQTGEYLYLCKSVREKDKVNQKVIRYIGKIEGIKDLDKDTVWEILKGSNYHCSICRSKKGLAIINKKVYCKKHKEAL